MKCSDGVAGEVEVPSSPGPHSRDKAGDDQRQDKGERNGSPNAQPQPVRNDLDASDDIPDSIGEGEGEVVVLVH